MRNRCHGRRGRLPLRMIFLSLIAVQGINAAWIRFNVTSLNPGQSAVGYEQIFRVAGTGPGGNGLNGPGFDYTYLVWNTGASPIDGFFFDVGVANTKAAVAAFVAASVLANDTFTAPGGVDDAVFPNAPFVGGLRPTPNINGELGPLNPYAFDSAPVNPINGPGVNPLPPLQGVLQQWGFQQYWNAGLTAYLARWYSNTPLNSFGPLPGVSAAAPRGWITRFDVFSPFGPVPGGGGVDPLDSGNFIAIEDGLGNFSDLITSPAVLPCDPTVPGSCDTSLPAELLGLQALGISTSANGNVPEPAPMVLIAIGLACILPFRRRRTSKEKVDE
jgi:hypothetical protein